MCQKLSRIEQIHIKQYLEKFDTFQDYDQILDFSIKRSQSNTLLNTPILHRNKVHISSSPLEDFFQTPIRRIKHSEKDQHIKHLKAELEVERTEKIELQDELKSEQNKVKIIGKKF